ncbi:glycosyltransferase family 2 protein [Paludisphaera borealis]|uniref:GT2 family glycosyltransferase n=1 Tax=Paludisphaera borealis TaxID=1387353 RepID=A0A1U7CXC2_9BACT|nr:glycosyltransferase family 2 protein [Paludisphaera borealis]APW63594.1 GT2 family glycosyltransferase [Paludisphaera borealis]
MTLFLAICLALALLPALIFLVNLGAYRPPPLGEPPGAALPLSVLIPARDEELLIGDAVRAVLANQGIEFEVLVLDDHSGDATAEIVEAIASRDDRVRLIAGAALPPGWCGKQYACWALAHEARHPVLVFLDADVRLAPDALGRMSAFLAASGADLASGIPHQETLGFLEKLLIPLIHFVMLGFMPIPSMRRTRMPSLSAGCGQLIVARRDSYFRAGGHAAIRASWHDGLQMPRLFRAAGLRNDLFDATDLAECRLYQTARDVWNGLAKNAGEALAAPRLIVPMTTILLGGQILPFLLIVPAVAGWPRPWSAVEWSLLACAVCAAWLPRFAAVARFRLPLAGAILHPLGVFVLVAIQWYALLRNLLGRPTVWKGRPQPIVHDRETV